MTSDDLIDTDVVAAARLDAELLVIGCLRDEGGVPRLSTLPESVRRAAQRLRERPGWRGAEGQYAEEPCADGPVERVALRGLGAADELHVAGLASWLRSTARQAAENGVGELELLLPSGPLTAGPDAVARISRELALASYRFGGFRGDDGDEGERRLSRIRIVLPEVDAASRAAVAVGSDVATAVRVTRDLANTPPNVATPEWIADRAVRLGAEFGLDVDVIDRDELEERGMGGILAVGDGSTHPPRLVRLVWDGAGSPRVALVGKGVTFDTGGISIKPSKDMEEMKFDKCGACTAVGLAVAAARLELPLHMTVYAPLAENMPDGGAYRPGDIVRTYSGKTVEILNTDAEGRMILADALARAAEDDPDYLVEFSTLTGACVVALGKRGAGLFSPSDVLAEELLGAAAAAGEQLWRMPLWPEFEESLSGHHADLKNTGSRWGGANVAASFLAQFTGSVEHWAHLDIAGPSMRDDDGKKDATGYGVALATRWLQGLADRGGTA